MRLLGVLALVAPAAVGILFLTNPGLTASWVADGSRSVVTAVTAVAIGVAMASAIAWTIVWIRYGRLVKAAERIAAGDYTVAVPTSGGGMESRLGKAINAISASLADTTDRATIDRLTGVVNRQALLAALFAEVERASRYERPLCIAFVDIDHFKAVNDSYGHASGDIVLRGVAQTIAENLRASDLIGRYGGEEFMLILTETDVEEGAALSEKLRKLVERLQFSVEGNSALSVTISIGIVGGSGQKLRMDNLVRDADAAMYSAKSLGRNQTYIFEEPDEDARVPRAPISDAGRIRAMEIGLRARQAATDMLTSYIAPLPHYRGQPSALIAGIVVEMARQLQLPEVEVDRIRIAALLHDVGKVAVPQEILDKPAPLSSAEWRSVVQHPRIGQVILEHAAALRDAVPIILHHHERFGGHGYPVRPARQRDPARGTHRRHRRCVRRDDPRPAVQAGHVARRRHRRAPPARRHAVRSSAGRAVLRPVFEPDPPSGPDGGADHHAAQPATPRAQGPRLGHLVRDAGRRRPRPRRAECIRDVGDAAAARVTAPDRAPTTAASPPARPGGGPARRRAEARASGDTWPCSRGYMAVQRRLLGSVSPAGRQPAPPTRRPAHGPGPPGPATFLPPTVPR